MGDLKLTHEHAAEAVDRIARHYEAIPYADMELLADSEYDWPTHTEFINGVEVTLYPNVHRVCGRRERISVEVFIGGPGVEGWRVKPCCYFERYPSGEIERFDSRSLRGTFQTLAKVVVLLGVLLIPVGLVALFLWSRMGQ